PSRRRAGRSQSRARIRSRLRRHLSGAGEGLRRPALSVLPRRRRGRSKAQPGGRIAPERGRGRGDRPANPSGGGGAFKEGKSVASLWGSPGWLGEQLKIEGAAS